MKHVLKLIPPVEPGDRLWVSSKQDNTIIIEKKEVVGTHFDTFYWKWHIEFKDTNRWLDKDCWQTFLEAQEALLRLGEWISDERKYAAGEEVWATILSTKTIFHCVIKSAISKHTGWIYNVTCSVGQQSVWEGDLFKDPSEAAKAITAHWNNNNSTTSGE